MYIYLYIYICIYITKVVYNERNHEMEGRGGKGWRLTGERKIEKVGVEALFEGRPGHFLSHVAEERVPEGGCCSSECPVAPGLEAVWLASADLRHGIVGVGQPCDSRLCRW